MQNYELSFAEIFTAIADGDWRVAAGFAAECIIMATPIIMLAALFYL